MRYYRPFCRSTWLIAAAAVTACVLATSPLRAQVAQVDQHAALSDGAKSNPSADKSAPSNPAAAAAANVAGAAEGDAAQKGIAGKAIDKVKEVAKSASDIFRRVPCLASKGDRKSTRLNSSHLGISYAVFCL